MKMEQNVRAALLLAAGVFTLGACQGDHMASEEQTAAVEQVIEKPEAGIDKALLIGSWIDTSAAALNFTLLADGTARSDNMRTLLYEHWRTEGDRLILTAKSIGNGVSSVSEEVYVIEVLTDSTLLLKEGTYERGYVRKK